MIGFLRGKLASKTPPQLVLDVQGVGYELDAPMTTFYDLPALGEEVMLHTHLVVREDAHQLFGFLREADRLMFRTLIKVNGVGPKLALTILSSQTAESFQQSIQNNDSNALIKVPGIGKKTAERLLVEMRDRLPDLGSSAAVKLSASLPVNTPKQEAISALCALGYKPADATRMVQAVDGEDQTCEQLIRAALQRAVRG